MTAAGLFRRVRVWRHRRRPPAPVRLISNDELRSAAVIMVPKGTLTDLPRSEQDGIFVDLADRARGLGCPPPLIIEFPTGAR